MNDKISATRDCNAELAVREKVFNNFVVEDGHEEGSGKAAESGADA